MKGKLYVVATPIGNLQDITFRALETLKRVNFIACEDTRNTRKLLSYYGIEGKKLLSYHDYNEEKMAPKILDILQREDVALLSDAGTPCISDPGYRVVKLCREKGIEVVPIPGAFAAAVAISASGLPTDKFLFLGFLSQKKTKRVQQLSDYMGLGYTLVLYESPKRVLETLTYIKDVDKDATVLVAKELTKVHERFLYGSVGEVLETLQVNSDLIRGEFVIVVSPSGKKEEIDIDQEILRLVGEGMSAREVASLLSQRFDLPKNKVYRRVLELRELS